MLNKKQKNKLLIFIIALFIALVVLWKFVLEGYYMFYKLEQEFVLGAKTYFETNTLQQPKKEGEYKTVNLMKLYETLSVEMLQTPKKKDYCNEDSWVKIIKTKDDFIYNHYLECGKYKSKTDHEGPAIVLNGEDVVYMKINEEYEELGVKSVVDNKEGKLKIEDVQIDTSDLNTSKFGEYVIKYIAYDSLKNRTVKERIVKVVMKMNDVVDAQTNSENVYKGKRSDNYILFSGNLFRIVKLNDDNTLMLVTDDSVSNLAYGYNENYDQSNIKAWLNDVFYKSLQDKSKLIKKDSTFCIDEVSNLNDVRSCKTYSKPAAVGLLDIHTIKQTEINNDTFLDSFYGYWLSNPNTDKSGWIKFIFAREYKGYETWSKDELLPVRPVINIDATELFLIDGDGSKQNPFKLNDYEYGEVGDLVNKRLPGEFVKISGYLWKIVGVDSKGNTKLIMNEVIKDLTTHDLIPTTWTNKDKVKKFNSKQRGNIGYEINNDIVKFVNDKLFVESTFDYPLYNRDKKYNEYETYEEKSLFSIPKSYDLHSGVSSESSLTTGRYFIADYTNDEYRMFIINERNGIVFKESTGGEFKDNNVKLVGYLNKDKKIANGDGTLYNPYFVR